MNGFLLIWYQYLLQNIKTENGIWGNFEISIISGLFAWVQKTIVFSHEFVIQKSEFRNGGFLEISEI